jgi:hypothetical protein
MKLVGNLHLGLILRGALVVVQRMTNGANRGTAVLF